MGFNIRHNNILKWFFGILTLSLSCYLLLLIPDKPIAEPKIAQKQPFLWNQDRYWDALESEFNIVRLLPKSTLSAKIDSGFINTYALLDSISIQYIQPQSPLFERLEEAVFQLGPEIAAQPERLPNYAVLSNAIRDAVKRQSKNWDMNSIEARRRLYRLIYGGRAAIEEIMLQQSPDSVKALQFIADEPSATPFVEMRGVKIHSGDILVSRGGAATSALIARGNDFPGNFSHVALAYVDSHTNKLSILEAHIERGVTISPPEKYLGDTKLRIMVLRLRSDLEPLILDPKLPHKAAKFMYGRATAGHIAYDFQMDISEPEKLFCSEVASAAYRQFGINLWMGLSSISNVGIARWLAAFGVTHFETQEPSDLEYDPQLRVIAEWRDPETLYKDHLDNAIIDAMLEDAQKGIPLKYDWYMLPFGRIAKGYSLILNVFGRVGPVPEGMNASSALRNKRFTKSHANRKERLQILADKFQIEKGYRPPYWDLYKMALSTAER